MDIPNICFVIANKYYRNYPSYIQHYVDNIQKYYNNSLCIIVDNNSKYISDIIDKLKDYKNVIILENNSLCKFELGAYKIGIKYLIQNNLIENYEYFVFSQDTFVLKNKFNFNTFKEHNVVACPIIIGPVGHHIEMLSAPQSQIVLKRLNLHNSIDKIAFCWANTFILHKSKLTAFVDITNDIIITKKIETEWCERYIAAILYYLNNYINCSLNTILNILYTPSYNCHTVDIYDEHLSEYFVKKIHFKSELTTE